jgi:hypothetical protein
VRPAFFGSGAHPIDSIREIHEARVQSRAP